MHNVDKKAGPTASSNRTQIITQLANAIGRYGKASSEQEREKSRSNYIEWRTKYSVVGEGLREVVLKHPQDLQENLQEILNGVQGIDGIKAINSLIELYGIDPENPQFQSGSKYNLFYDLARQVISGGKVAEDVLKLLTSAVVYKNSEGDLLFHPHEYYAMMKLGHHKPEEAKIAMRVMVDGFKAVAGQGSNEKSRAFTLALGVFMDYSSNEIYEVCLEKLSESEGKIFKEGVKRFLSEAVAVGSINSSLLPALENKDVKGAATQFRKAFQKSMTGSLADLFEGKVTSTAWMKTGFEIIAQSDNRLPPAYKEEGRKLTRALESYRSLLENTSDRVRYFDPNLSQSKHALDVIEKAIEQEAKEGKQPKSTLSREEFTSALKVCKKELDKLEASVAKKEEAIVKRLTKEEKTKAKSNPEHLPSAALGSVSGHELQSTKTTQRR